MGSSPQADRDSGCDAMKLIQLPRNTKIPFIRWQGSGAGGGRRSSSFSFARPVSRSWAVNLGIRLSRRHRRGSCASRSPSTSRSCAPRIGELGLGEVQIVEFGRPTDVLIRVEEQAGGDEAQQRVVILLRDLYEGRADFRRGRGGGGAARLRGARPGRRHRRHRLPSSPDPRLSVVQVRVAVRRRGGHHHHPRRRPQPSACSRSRSSTSAWRPSRRSSPSSAIR